MKRRNITVISRAETTSIRLLLTFLLLCALASCDQSYTPSPFRPLEKGGIQLLSPSNPYHGPNIILGEAIEESPNLAGYFHHHGAPAAVEVRKAGRFAEELLLYYPEDRRVYVAKRKRQPRSLSHPSHLNSAAHDWMVTGPYGIGKLDYRRLAHFPDIQRRAVFLIHGKEVRYGKRKRHTQQLSPIEPEVPLIPTPTPTPTPAAVVITEEEPTEEEDEEGKDSAEPKDSRVPDLDDPNFVPINSDQEALLLSLGYARRAPNGDILHEVEGNAQELKNIAHWYLGSASKVHELIIANQYPEAQENARKGSVVIIPKKFITNTKKMPLEHRAVRAPEPMNKPAETETNTEEDAGKDPEGESP
ncbi:hypothetical protein MRY87_05100 [bacterium]|nr:hypothetical protein [bacterium]